MADIDDVGDADRHAPRSARRDDVPPLSGRCHRRGARPRDRGDEQGTRAAECRAPDASGEAKANIEAAIERQRAKLDALVARVEKALADRKAEFEARLSTLRAQHDRVREEQRQQIQERIDELKASYAARTEKLEEARRLAKASAEKTREALAV